MARNRWSNITAYHTVAEITDEVNSINNKYKEVRLTDDEFEDMYRQFQTFLNTTPCLHKKINQVLNSNRTEH